MQDKFHEYEQDSKAKVLIVVIDTRVKQQHLHIPLVRHLVDQSEQAYNSINRTAKKHYLILIHSPSQDLYHRSCFPAIFLCGWEYYFFDICARGSAFHLQRMIETISSSFDEKQNREPSNDVLYDLNTLFEDCLWDFCSRIQMLHKELPRENFSNTMTFEFYHRGTSIIKRVRCLKDVIKKYVQLQESIVNLYRNYLTTKKNSVNKIYNLIYQISKDIVCGKRFDGLVESIRHRIRIPFMNFVSNVLKFIVTDHGLETLLNMKHVPSSFDAILNAIDPSAFSVVDDSEDLFSNAVQGAISINIHYSFIPDTLMFNLFYQRIKSHVDEIKSSLVQKENESEGLLTFSICT